MKKQDIEQIRIDIECDGQSALSMMLHKDGTVGRSGNGSLPRNGKAVLGVVDPSLFAGLIESLDEQMLARAAIYDHPNKLGRSILYRVVFLGPKPQLARFEFRLGEENRDVGDLLPLLDAFCGKAVALTEEWYAKAIA